MKLYTVRWIRGKNQSVKIQAVDENGKLYILRRLHRDWIGIATNDIVTVMKELKDALPGVETSHSKLDDKKYKEILPLFYHRILAADQGDHEPKSFYRVFVHNVTKTADVGDFLNGQNVSYYREEDWLTRIYLDLNAKLHCAENFYYNWYEIDLAQKDLLLSFVGTSERSPPPPMTLASFDLETVPWEVGGSRVPTGHNEKDRIVMISLVIGDALRPTTTGLEKYVYYLNPIAHNLDIASNEEGVAYVQHRSERAMLLDFLDRISDPKILFLTGYNVNNFDFPCLFARLTFLDCYEQLVQFRSRKIGQHLITTFRGKYVVDLYNYILSFSSANLPSFKLADVVRARLPSDMWKVPIHPIAIHKWYQARDALTSAILESKDLRECFDFVRPGFASEQTFGTFPTCLSYCLRDSEAVLALAHVEHTVSFLISRANVSSMNVEEVLYGGNSRYLQCVFETYGTTLGYFLNLRRLENLSGDGIDAIYEDHSKAEGKQKYQGALNHCEPGFYRNVGVFDFESLYPSSIIYANISYETFAVLHVDTYRKLGPRANQYRCIPFETHDDSVVFRDERTGEIGEHFEFAPATTSQRLVMVISRDECGFLPTFIKHFIERRREEQRLKAAAAFGSSLHTYHNNRQLSFKLLMNSLYGILGSANSVLSNLSAGMSVTCVARNMLIQAYRYIKRTEGVQIPYGDTDSLFVVGVREKNDISERVNAFFDTECINLKYESFFPSILVLKKKKYCYEKTIGGDAIHTKGIQARSNEVTKCILNEVLHSTYDQLRNGDDTPDYAEGWSLLVKLLTEAFFASRNPLKNCSTVKVRKSLEDYVPHCRAPHVRLMRREPRDRCEDFLNFTHVLTNVSLNTHNELNPVYVENVDERYHSIDFEKLYKTQHSEILELLDLGFFKLPDRESFRSVLSKKYEELVELMKWRRAVNAAAMYRARFHEDLLVLQLPGVRYSFVRPMDYRLRNKKKRPRCIARGSTKTCSFYRCRECGTRSFDRKTIG